jgi:hypothetical protein
MPIKDWLIQHSDSPLWKEILQTRIKLRDIYLKYWLEYNVFSLSWWLMLILVISLWFIWWKRVDKARLHEIITYGAIVSLIATIIDIVGCEYVLWGYTADLVPLISPLLVTDYCFLPITYMLLYQYFTDWRSFITATTIVSALLAFIAESIAVLLDIYQLNNWKHLYSFPMYILLAIFFKWLLNKIIIKQKNSNSN